MSGNGTTSLEPSAGVIDTGRPPLFDEWRELKIAFTAADSDAALEGVARLRDAYGGLEASSDAADVIVVLGGDGTMLETLHQNITRDVPIYGMNLGSVGFLMNDFRPGGLLERLHAAQAVTLHPLRMTSIDRHGDQFTANAINEVSLLRETRQAAKLRIHVDGVVRLDELICDGILVATPAGSTAYNLSAHGPIMPLESNLLALTPISAFRPRRWRGALLSHKTEVTIEVLEPHKRPVSAVADYTEVRDVHRVTLGEDRALSMTLLFDPERDLSERIIAEQFVP